MENGTCESWPDFLVMENPFAVSIFRQLVFDHFKMASGKFVKFHFSFPHSGILESVHGFLAYGVFMNGFSNMRSFV